MKNLFKSVFSKADKRKRRTGIILTIVALVEILAIMVVSTSAWIESISSIKVYTTAQTEVGGTKGVVASKLKQRLGIALGDSNDIDLTQYFRPSGGYHLSGASSADGNQIYFPETKGNTTQKYRVGTINDKNVNYVSFTVKTTTGNVALAFDSAPTFKFGGTALSGDNLKLLRFAVGNGSTFKVFSLASEFEDTVISGENPTDTTTSLVRAFSDYAVGNSNLVTTTTANGYLTFSMWIQDPTGASSSVYNNKALTVENLKLVAVKPFTLKSTYMNDSGAYVAGSTGGTVAINNGEFGETAVAYLKNGSVVTLKASPNTTNGYSFVGWSKTANGSVINNMGVGNCTNNNGIYSIMYTFNTSDFTGDYELYAQFNDRHILYLKPNYKHYNNSNGSIKFYAYIWGSVNGVFKKEWYSSTYNSTKAAYEFTYKGSANSVIFCYMSPSTPSDTQCNIEEAKDSDDSTKVNIWDTYRYLQTYDLSFPLENGTYTYVVTSRRYPYTGDNGNNHVIGYWEHSYARINISKCNDTASQNTNNKISMYLNDAYTHYQGAGIEARYSNTSSLIFDGKTYTTDGDGKALTHPYNATVTLNNTPGSAYNFDGWYTNAAGTGTKLTTAQLNSLTAANASAPNSGTTYYAKFKLKPQTYYVKGSFNDWGESDQLTGSGTTLTKTIHLNEGNYTFKIWEKRDNAYWSVNNTNYYAHATSPNLPSNAQMYQSQGELNLWVTAGNYTFSYNTSTNKLSISVSSYDTVTIWFKPGSLDVNAGSAYMFCEADGLSWGIMTKSTSGDTDGCWYRDNVPSIVRDGFKFNRCSDNSGGTTWNKWNAGSRVVSGTAKGAYTSTAWGDAYGNNGAGDWS